MTVREERGIDGDVFGRQLNRLFRRAGRQLTNLAVVMALREQGCSISTPYLSQLRTGVRTNPSSSLVDALANFFDVQSDYFFDIDADPDAPVAVSATGMIDSDAAFIAGLSNSGLRRLLALSQSLSPRSIELLVALSDRLRLADRR